MKMTLESTTKFVELDGVPARIWEGTTERGIRVQAFVTRVAVREGDPCDEFEAELTECRPPSAAAQAWPARMVL